MESTYSFSAEAEKYGFSGESGNWYKISEGDNRLRVLSVGAPVVDHFSNGKPLGICFGVDAGCPHHGGDERPGVKWLFWVLDYKDNQMKLARLPHTIFKALAELQNSVDYSFNSVPMPYDITIKAKGAGTKEVEYNVIPARQNSEVLQDILGKLEKEKSPLDIVAAMKDKQKKKLQPEAKVDYPENNLGEQPF